MTKTPGPQADPRQAHTALPWVAYGRSSTILDGHQTNIPAHVLRRFVDDQGRRCTQYIADCNSALAECDANARFIVTAVNAHADLLSALKAVKSTSRGYACWCDASHNNVEYGHQPKCVAASAAIAKAEAQS